MTQRFSISSHQFTTKFEKENFNVFSDSSRIQQSLVCLIQHAVLQSEYNSKIHIDLSTKPLTEKDLGR